MTTIEDVITSMTNSAASAAAEEEAQILVKMMTDEELQDTRRANADIMLKLMQMQIELHDEITAVHKGLAMCVEEADRRKKEQADRKAAAMHDTSPQAGKPNTPWRDDV